MQQHRGLLINLNLLFFAIISGAVVLYLFWRVIAVTFSVLILLLAAMLLAFLLSPLVSWLEALGLPRGLAVLCVYVGLLALIFGLGGLLIAPLTVQIQGLAKNLPQERHQLSQVLASLDTFFQNHGIPVHLESLQQQGLNQATQIGQQLLAHTLDIVQTAAHIVIDILAIIVISLYLLIDGPRLRHNILRVIPEGSRNNVLFVEAAIRTVVGSYVRGQLLLALIIGLMATAGCFLIGVPYALVLGLAAGFFELVPMLGPILGALPAIGVAAFHGGWQLAVATVVLYVVIQQLEAHIIAPRIMGHAVGVHPIVAILAVLFGAERDGILGALVAVPVAGIIYVISQALYSHVTGQQQVVTVVQRRPLLARLVRRLRGAPPASEGGKEGTVTVTVEAPSDQLASIVHERDVLAEQFAQAEKIAQEVLESGGRPVPSGSTPVPRPKPDDSPSV
ncbi:MAG: AI-2E family transporter [Chloroflexi bacterium]|nr:AI-2E family transporter [Chloroflexota bacterium]